MQRFLPVPKSILVFLLQGPEKGNLMLYRSPLQVEEGEGGCERSGAEGGAGERRKRKEGGKEGEGK